VQSHSDVSGALPQTQSYQEIAADFEGHIRRFMKKMKFKGVDGGPTFKIGGNQIDAVGIHERTLFVIECVLRTRGADQPLRAKIKALRGIMFDVKKAVHSEKKYKDVEEIRFIISTTDRVIKKEDLEYAGKIPPIYIWDGNLIEYYRSLQRKVGQYAKYNLLAEMGVQPVVKRELRVPCMKIRVYDRTLYSFFAPPRDLLRFCYVARREMARESYYQRLVERRRILSIATDFLNKHGVFPNSVLLAFNKPPVFSSLGRAGGVMKQVMGPKGSKAQANIRLTADDVELGVLIFPEEYQSCWIIDGQHRLYAFAFARASADQKISVIAFDKLPLEEQARYFLDINSNQKPVPPDLLWDLKGELMPSSRDGVISRVVKELNDKGSLRNCIYLPAVGLKKPGKKLLKFSGMCTDIKRRKLSEKQTEHMQLVSDKNPLYRRNPDLQVQRLSAALNDYFEMVNEVLSTEEKHEFWLQNSGVAILVALYECMLRRIGTMPDKQELRVYVGALGKTFRDQQDDVRLLRLQCSSEGGRTELTREFVSKIASLLGDQDFSIPGASAAFERRVSRFEREFAGFLVQKLAESPAASGNWIRDRIPPGIIDRLVQSYGKLPDDIAKYLTLGECNEILRSKSNWMLVKDAFVRGPRGFPSEDACRIALEYVTEHRNAMIHKRPLRPGYSDEVLRDAYFRKLGRCLTETIRETSGSQADQLHE